MSILQSKLNLILLGLVVLLATAVYVVKQNRQQDTELRLPINTQTLSRIEIQHTSNLTLQKKADDWYLIFPQQGKVHPERMEKILSHLNLPLDGGFAAQETDLSLYGLDQPTLLVKLDEQILRFGHLNTLRQMHYIEFAGKVYLAPPFLQISFDHSVDDLLIKELP